MRLKECVTHSLACPCREENFRKLENENKQLREQIGKLLENDFNSKIFSCEDDDEDFEIFGFQLPLPTGPHPSDGGV